MKHLLFGGPGGATTIADVGLLVGRLGAGLMLAFGHGLGKIKNPSGFAGFLEKLNVPAPGAAAWIAAITEFFGGLLLAAGLLTRPVSALIGFTMIVAVFTAHRADPLFGGGKSKEMALLYLTLALVFLFAGAGRFSIDRFLGGKRGRRGRGFPVG